MSKPHDKDNDRRSDRSLLRRQDQRFLAGLIVLAGLAGVGWWGHNGGPSNRLAERRPAPTRTARFVVDANTAAWPELTQIPEIGETLARRIVENRREEGLFGSPEELTRVRGIGNKTLEQMRPYLDCASLPDGSPPFAGRTYSGVQ